MLRKKCVLFAVFLTYIISSCKQLLHIALSLVFIFSTFFATPVVSGFASEHFHSAETIPVDILWVFFHANCDSKIIKLLCDSLTATEFDASLYSFCVILIIKDCTNWQISSPLLPHQKLNSGFCYVFFYLGYLFKHLPQYFEWNPQYASFRHWDIRNAALNRTHPVIL